MWKGEKPITLYMFPSKRFSPMGITGQLVVSAFSTKAITPSTRKQKFRINFSQNSMMCIKGTAHTPYMFN